MSIKGPSVRQRQILLFLAIFIVAYFVFRFFSTGTLEIESKDWGIDMGYTQLFWGLLAVAYCFILLFYFKQKQFRFKETDKAVLLLLSTPIFFLIGLFLASGQFVLHDPFINAYHRPEWTSWFDKIGHFLAAFLLTIIALNIHPTRFTIIFMLLLTFSYEAFEIVFIWNLGQDAGMSLAYELDDIIPDMFANLVGIFTAFWLERKNIKG